MDNDEVEELLQGEAAPLSALDVHEAPIIPAEDMSKADEAPRAATKSRDPLGHLKKNK